MSIFGKPVLLPKKLPYTPLAYLESTGTQWINTLYCPINASRCALEAELSSAAGSYPTPFGTRRAVGNASFLVFTRYNGAAMLYYDVCTGDKCVGSMSGCYDRRVTLELSRSRVSVSGGEGAPAADFSGGSLSNAAPLFLFTLGSGGSDYGTVCHCRMKLYRFRIWEGDAPVRDFVPALDANGVACLYETVTGQFFYNVGTGSFGYA